MLSSPLGRENTGTLQWGGGGGAVAGGEAESHAQRSPLPAAAASESSPSEALSHTAPPTKVSSAG